MPVTRFPLDRWFTITPAVDGALGEMGNASNEGDSGVLSVQFVTNDPSFVGNFAVFGKAMGEGVTEYEKNFAPNMVPHVPILYRAHYLNNAISDGTLRSDLITGNSLIVIPAVGIKVYIQINCSVGTATIFPRRCIGSMIF